MVSRYIPALAVCAVLALTGCHRPADSAYYNRGGPESRLDVSSEVVNLSVAGPNELAQLSGWVEQDAPTRAELYCSTTDKRCSDARNVLEVHGVPTMVVPSMDYTVALVYERVLARDCNARFVDNHNNNYNAAAPAFGCSVSANMVQQVSDKQEFVNPNIMDVPRANGALSAQERAYTPRPALEPYTIDTSAVRSAKTD